MPIYDAVVEYKKDDLVVIGGKGMAQALQKLDERYKIARY